MLSYLLIYRVRSTRYVLTYVRMFWRGWAGLGLSFWGREDDDDDDYGDIYRVRMEYR